MDFRGIYTGLFLNHDVKSYTLDTRYNAIKCSGVYVNTPESALIVFVEEGTFSRLFFAEFKSPKIGLSLRVREISLSTDISYYLPRASIFSIN